jgi:hypothetical protein
VFGYKGFIYFYDLEVSNILFTFVSLIIKNMEKLETEEIIVLDKIIAKLDEANKIEKYTR